MSADDTHSLHDEMLEAIEGDLKDSIQRLSTELTPELAHMIVYHMGWTDGTQARSGKRIRPLLTLLSCAGAGADWKKALPAASAIEWIHNFSLVHDDIEDQSETRRGQPTIWKRWGIAQAINTGDAIFTLAHLATYRLNEVGVSHAISLMVQHIIDKACLQLTQGQHMDIAFESREHVSIDDYFRMIEGKTSALLSAAMSVGACIAAATASTVEAYRLFGHHLGLAFQIQDDILGIWGKPDHTGKPAGDDLSQRKKTLPTLYGLEKSTAFARLYSQDTDEVEQADLITALDQCDAFEHARSISQHHTDIALSSLKEAAPSDPAGKIIITLSQRLLERQS